MKAVMTRSLISLCLFAVLGSRYAAPLYADLQSTNYSVADEFMAGGGGANLSSSSYQLQEAVIEGFTRPTATSTNYTVEGKIGILGNTKIATIQSVTPGNYARFFTDESATFTVTATTAAPDTLQYEGKQDGVTKDGPQTSNILTWPLSASDKGRRAIALNAIDPDGTTSKQQAAYVYRRPVK